MFSDYHTYMREKSFIFLSRLYMITKSSYIVSRSSIQIHTRTSLSLSGQNTEQCIALLVL